MSTRARTKTSGTSSVQSTPYSNRSSPNPNEETSTPNRMPVRRSSRVVKATPAATAFKETLRKRTGPGPVSGADGNGSGGVTTSAAGRFGSKIGKEGVFGTIIMKPGGFVTCDSESTDIPPMPDAFKVLGDLTNFPTLTNNNLKSSKLQQQEEEIVESDDEGEQAPHPTVPSMTALQQEQEQEQQRRGLFGKLSGTFSSPVKEQDAMVANTMSDTKSKPAQSLFSRISDSFSSAKKQNHKDANLPIDSSTPWKAASAAANAATGNPTPVTKDAIAATITPSTDTTYKATIASGQKKTSQGLFGRISSTFSPAGKPDTTTPLSKSQRSQDFKTPEINLPGTDRKEPPSESFFGRITQSLTSAKKAASNMKSKQFSMNNDNNELKNTDDIENTDNNRKDNVSDLLKPQDSLYESSTPGMTGEADSKSGTTPGISREAKLNLLRSELERKIGSSSQASAGISSRNRVSAPSLSAPKDEILSKQQRSTIPLQDALRRTVITMGTNTGLRSSEARSNVQPSQSDFDKRQPKMKKYSSSQQNEKPVMGILGEKRGYVTASGPIDWELLFVIALCLLAMAFLGIFVAPLARDYATKQHANYVLSNYEDSLSDLRPTREIFAKPKDAVLNVLLAPVKFEPISKLLMSPVTINPAQAVRNLDLHPVEATKKVLQTSANQAKAATSYAINTPRNFASSIASSMADKMKKKPTPAPKKQEDEEPTLVDSGVSSRPSQTITSVLHFWREGIKHIVWFILRIPYYIVRILLLPLDLLVYLFRQLSSFVNLHTPNLRKRADDGTSKLRGIVDRSSDYVKDKSTKVGNSFGALNVALQASFYETLAALKSKMASSPAALNHRDIEKILENLLDKRGLFGIEGMKDSILSEVQKSTKDEINSRIESSKAEIYDELIQDKKLSGSIKQAVVNDVLPDIQQEILLAIKAAEETQKQARDSGLFHDIDSLVSDFVELYAADKGLQPDFAYSSTGAYILSSNPKYAEQIFDYITNLGKSLFLRNMFQPAFPKQPSVILNSDVSPGQCWAFRGEKGSVTIQLSRSIKATAITLEHTPRGSAFSRSSAPRDFSAYAIPLEDGDSEYFLGSWIYDLNGKHMQTFAIQGVRNVAIRAVRIDFNGNHGNQDYTCVYRVRVHGDIL